eukprot:912760-Prymnesium_polylepis.1
MRCAHRAVRPDCGCTVTWTAGWVSRSTRHAVRPGSVAARPVEPEARSCALALCRALRARGCTVPASHEQPAHRCVLSVAARRQLPLRQVQCPLAPGATHVEGASLRREPSATVSPALCTERDAHSLQV